MAVDWLSDDEQHTWRALIRFIHELRAEQEEALVEAHGITDADYGVLVQLSEAEDRRLRMCDLAQQMRMSPSGLTRRIDALARRGFVSRETSPSDRRVMLAVLTDDGLAKLRAAAPTHVAAVRRSLFDHLSDEQVQRLGELIGQAQESRHQPVTPTRGSSGGA
jgi:DNA-binding MarR family transcriptional regulator